MNQSNNKENFLKSFLFDETVIKDTGNEKFIDVKTGQTKFNETPLSEICETGED